MRYLHTHTHALFFNANEIQKRNSVMVGRGTQGSPRLDKTGNEQHIETV